MQSRQRLKLIGTKDFYRRVRVIAIPIIIQNLITTFVNLLDNIMVGSIGIESMSGVSIANQLIFIFNLAVFGGLSGIGIFTAQFFGAKKLESVRQTIRAKAYLIALLLAIFLVAVFWKGEALISLFLQSDDEPAVIARTLSEGMAYLHVMLIGLVPACISQVSASSLRESGETRLPMVSGIAAVFTNLILNYVLIFGHFGAPALGVRGAAVATVISRFVEAGITLGVSLKHLDKYPFFRRLFARLRIDKTLLSDMFRKSTPLLVNEFLWSLAVSGVTQSYSTRGIAAISASQINSTVTNLFSTIYFAFGSVISIMVGQLLGAGNFKQAKEEDTQLLAFSVALSAVLGVICFLVAPFFPRLYNTTGDVKDLAASMIRIAACFMPISCFAHASYFTLRSGGKTIITFLFDSVFQMGVAYPVSYVLSRYTDMPMLYLYLCVQSLDLVKAMIGFILVHKNVWIHNITHAGEKIEEPQAETT